MTAPAPTLADLLAVAARVEALHQPAGLSSVPGRCEDCLTEDPCDVIRLARAVRALVGAAVGHEPVTPDVIDDDGIRHRGKTDYCGADGETWPCQFAQTLAAALDSALREEAKA